MPAPWLPRAAHHKDPGGALAFPHQPQGAGEAFGRSACLGGDLALGLKNLCLIPAAPSMSDSEAFHVDSLLQVSQVLWPGCTPFHPTRKLRLDQVEVSSPGCGCGHFSESGEGAWCPRRASGDEQRPHSGDSSDSRASNDPAGSRETLTRLHGAWPRGQPLAPGAPRSTGGHGHCPHCTSRSGRCGSQDSRWPKEGAAVCPCRGTGQPLERRGPRSLPQACRWTQG